MDPTPESEKLRRIEMARQAATVDASAGKGPPLDAARLLADSERPSVQVPGYSIIREIGRGGQAVVYLAIQSSTGQKVALKLTREGPFADERSRARFNREVQILAALNHPNIVTIIDTGQTADGNRYIVMKYISGFGLGEYMQRHQRKDHSDPGKLLRLFLRICAAVNAAHRQGIVHRDLKPGNIRVDDRGEPHILDFGLARAPLDRFVQGGHQPVSITGEFLGSLPWCSPEQAEGHPDNIDIRSDVYSLGVILYQMLTGGAFPYEVVGNIRDVLNNILTTEPMPPSKMIASAQARETQSARKIAARHPSAVNEAIEKIVLKALSKPRESRYQSAGELGRDIANYLAGQQTSTPESDTDALDPDPGIRLRRYVRPAMAILVLGILIAGVTAAWHHFRDRSQGPGGPALASMIPPDMLPSPPSGQQWELAWNDEFDGPILDRGKWDSRSGVGPDGEYWSRDAVSLDDQGHLVISITSDGNQLKTGSVSTAGKFDQPFGFFVCRVLFQEQAGHSSTFRLERDGGDIEVFKMRGPNSELEQAIGIDRMHDRKSVSLPGATDQWHTLAVWCTPDKNVFYIDGRESWRKTVDNASQLPKHLMLSGGIGSLAPGGEGQLPDSFLVDYVRVYRLVKK